YRVIKTPTSFRGKIFYKVTDSISGFRLKMTGIDINDFVKPPRQMKPCKASCGFNIRMQLLIRKPPPVGKSKVKTVSVMSCLIAGKNRKNFSCFNFPDALQSVFYKFLFNPKLLLVINILQGTATAYSEVLTERDGSVLGLLFEFRYFPKDMI